MPYQKKDQQLFRLLRIVKRLYAFEILQGSLLAEEYNVSTRTLSRDMKKISTIIPLHNKRGIWSLDTDTLRERSNHLNDSVLGAFARNVDMTMACFEKSNLSKNKVAFAIEYNHLPKDLGAKIIQAIENEVRCSFTYIKKEKRTGREVDPIKLYTENGRWYLVARDHKDDKVKTFLLSSIQNYKLLNIPVSLTEAMRREADNIKSVWSSGKEDVSTVKLYIKANIAEYMEDIKLHKTQEIIDRHHDGGLEVHCKITHKLEIFPAIKSWLPNIHILEPKWLQDELMKDLEYYKAEEYNVT